MKLYFETPIDLPFEKVRDRFTKDLFLALAPGTIPFRLVRFDGCEKGNIVQIKLGPKFLSQDWMSEITFEETNASGWSFIDEGKVLPWPLRYWKHHHRVDMITPTQCKIVDDITYDCSSRLLNLVMKPFLWSAFSIRPKRYKEFFKD